ncbi:MAG TPA: tetratricopeptide repeat protein [Telluria sp.]|nr:tetratricopeptide repeat protein [Telluria sp.]
MSLLMQALKKAEQAKRSHAGAEDLIKPSEEFDDVLELAPQEEPPRNRRATDPVPLDVPNGIEPPDFSLEPIEPPPIHDALTPELEVPSWNEAQPPEDIPDALHTAVPPAASVPPADGPPTAQARRPAPHADRIRPQRAEAAAAARQHGARTGPPPPPPAPSPVTAAPLRVPNARTMRLAALLGVLFLIAATFGYLYWRAVYGAGSSKNLPPVPMPGLAGAPGAPVQPQGSVIVIPPGGAQPPGYEAQTYTPPAYTALPSTQGEPVQPRQPDYPAAQPAPAAGAVPQTFPSNIGAAPAPQVTAAQPPMQSAPPPPVATPAQNVPAPAPEQMQGLSPEDYARMDRQAAEAADARAAAANAQPTGSGVTVTPSPVAAPATTATVAGQPPAAMPPTTSGDAPVQVRQRTSSGEVDPALQSAYVAFRQGDLATAREQYNALLQADPRNRDALLGSAAIALRDRQPERAADIYARLLEADPNDADALAGLVAIRQTDPVQTEARLRRIINLNPEAASALSALGNLYARQGRWSEAQQQYFKAYAVLPQNADYAYNLAVALDRINQPKLAQTYYQRAVALAAGGTPGFDTNAAATRLRELGAR